MSSNRLFPDRAAGGTIARHDRTAWLKGGQHHCLLPPRTPPGKVRRIILLGAPGVGKDAQAGLLCERLGTCHLSVGDVFSAARSCNESDLSPATQNALDHLKRGDPVPDETVLNLVGERLRCLNCAGGFVLDGFPRTVAQAKALEQLLESHGIQLTAVINYELPSDRSGETYQKNIQPLIEFYQQRGQLFSISASGTPEDIYQRTRLAVQARD
ncbi:MAG TPA: nucleoside monophosphate kinase [Verrucomicrobiae bacterium]